jgi:hypothetical protein
VRRKLKRFRVLIFALSILMSFCLDYSWYEDWSQIPFVSSDLTLENFEITDQENLVADSVVPSKEIVSASFLNLRPLRIHPFKDSFPFPFQPFSVEHKISVLRC